MGRLARTLALSVAMVLPVADQAWAVDRFVDEDGSGAAPCTSTANPCPTIAGGIAAAGSGDAVRVGGGTYAESVTLGSGKSLIASNFNPGLTADGPPVIDTAGAGPAIDLDSAAGTIQGFTLRPQVVLDASATLRQNTFDSPTSPEPLDVIGGAGATQVVEDNTFVDATPASGTFGIYVGTSGSARIAGNSITGYETGVRLGGASLELAGNTFNQIGKFGVYIPSSPATVTDNVFNRPTGTGSVGIHVEGTMASATLKRNQLIGWDRGVWADVSSSLTMNGDMVINGASRGLDLFDGGMLNKGDVSGVNVTVAGYPTQAYTDGANLSLRDSIIGDVTSGDAITKVNGGGCSLTNVRGPLENPATDCRNYFSNAAPGFVNLAGDDAHLAPGSAMIDLVVPATSEPDLDGDARPTRGIDNDNDCDALGDIGADEYAPVPAYCAPPETSITSGPSGATADSTPSFGFSSTKSPATFQCQVDSGGFAACTSPFTTAPLANGAHTFAVRAIEKHGIADPSPATRAFSIGPAAGSGGASAGGGSGGSGGAGSGAGGSTVALSARALTMDRRGVVAVPVSCANAACAGRLALATAGRVSLSRRARVRLGSRAYSIPAGKRAKVRIRLSRRKRALVRRLRRLRVRVTIAPRGGRPLSRVVRLRARRR